MKLLFKGSILSGQRIAAAQNRDLIIFGDGTGGSQMLEVANAGDPVELGIYVKCGGVRTTDAEWGAAQPYVWRQPNGQPYTQGQNGWAYGDIQRYAREWYEAVVKPHIAAQLAKVPAGCLDWIMVDNCIYQHPTLFVPKPPPDYETPKYHDATLQILLWIGEDFPGYKRLPNGWQGSAPVGYQGQALGSTSPLYCEGVWFEGVRYKAGGGAQSAARFQQDQGAFMSLMRAGKIVVWDEPGAVDLELRESFGLFAATTAVSVNPDNAYFNVPGTRWADWVRGL